MATFNNLRIQKRDGSIVEFDEVKIRNAIAKAFLAVNEPRTEFIDKIKDKINASLSDKNVYNIEYIQDLVEKTLVEFNLFDVAKAYILYRRQHEDLRRIGFILSSNDVVDSYLNVTDWMVKENSNMSYSIQGLNNHVASLVTSNYWLNKIYAKEMREAHINGELHIHDLGILATYCCGWDLKELLLRGFGGVTGKIESRPAKRFRTALGQIVNFFYTMQGESAGAQAFADFDTLLAPFVHYDDLTYKEVKQAIQEFVFNMNVPTRVGFQTPFTNITMDLTVPENMKDEPVVIGGEFKDATYKEFQKEMDMINVAFAEVMMEGDAKGRIFTFPIPTYNITKNFDWENKNLEPVWLMTAKYGIPYFSNFINSDLSPDDARSMCCRLRLDNRELIKRGGGLFGSNPLTGSIGVVTLNLPRVGYLSKSKQEVFTKLRHLMDIAKDCLEVKRKVLENYTELGLYPYSKYYLDTVKKRYNKYWANHFSTIGIFGMNEFLVNFIGKDITTNEGRELAIELMDYMRSVITEYQEETGCLFNLEATPAEGVSYRFANIDKRMYPSIIVANEKIWQLNKKIAPYYTNSTQLPVNFTDDLFEALELQDDLQTKYTGGTVFHIYLGERVPNPESVKVLVKKIASTYKLPYFTLSPTFSVCPSHGYIAGEKYKCPTCQAKCEVYSRIVGYIRPLQNWHDAKKAEFEDRKLFNMII